MENRHNIEEQAIQALIGGYIRSRSTVEMNSAADGPHLNHDTLAAFTEGSLSQAEARPFIGHLTNCSFCRHVTAELVRLDMAFAEAPIEDRVPSTAEPASVSSVLSSLFSKIFGTSDGAVFAHNEDEDQGSDEDAEEKRDTEQ